MPEILNRSYADAFYARYVFPHKQRIALCGINPGRLGAGLTGVPFVDVSFLSELFGVQIGANQERSAQFFRKLVRDFGAERFFASLYVTNFSTIGSSDGKKNVNYYDLPPAVQTLIGECFAIEMRLMNIDQIIPCSRDVDDSLRLLKSAGAIEANIDDRLPHPYWSSFENRAESQTASWKQRLRTMIQ